MALVQSQKIVLVINSLQGGGAEKFVLTLGEAFYQMGFDVHILCFDPKIEYDIPNGLHYHLIEYKRFRWLPRNKLRFLVFSRIVDKYIKKNIGNSLFILSNLILADRVFSYSKLPNIAYVIHSTLSTQFEFSSKSPNNFTGQNTLKRIYEKHPCICVSKGVQNDIQRNFGEKCRTHVIYNPIDFIKVQEQAGDLDIPKGEFIVHIGSFKKAKRHDVLLKSYKQTSQKFPLYLLGKGGLQEQVENLILELELQNKVKVLGFMKNPYPYLKAAKAKVLASDREGLPTVLIEATALGTPVISTNCYSGPNEILPKDNLVPVNDVNALADKIEELMSNPNNFIVPFNEQFLPINVARQYLAFMGVNFE